MIKARFNTADLFTLFFKKNNKNKRRKYIYTELSLGFWKQEFRTPIWQKVGVPLEKVGVPLKKSWSPTNLCIPYILSILAGSDTFE